MLNFIIELLDRLPLLSSNLRALILVSLLSLFLGVTGYPLYLVYNNEDEITAFMLDRLNQGTPYTIKKDHLASIKATLTDLIYATSSDRAIFGIVRNDNRMILLEAIRPFDAPLPEGFQSVYIGAGPYRPLLDILKSGQCGTLQPSIHPDDPLATYLDVEMAHSSSTSLVVCPSPDSWFIGLYRDDSDTMVIYQLNEAMREILDILKSAN